jgi:hypothetical protein
VPSKEKSSAYILPLLIIFAAFTLGYLLPSYSKFIFLRHRAEFIQFAASATLAANEKREIILPATTFFRGAGGYQDSDGTIILDCNIDDFYLPLIYVSSDNSMQVHDACAKGGLLVEKLQTNWYVCQRDRN